MAAEEPDPYLVLGVARHATAAEIRAAYRALGAKYHPDLHQGNPLEGLASEKMAELNGAYAALSDPARRRAYDERHAGSARGGWSRGAGGREGTPDATASGRASRRTVPLAAVILLLPLALRFGGLIVRGLAVVGRELFEGLTVLRGTPFVLGAVLLAMGALLWALLRRRRRGRPAPVNRPG